MELIDKHCVKCHQLDLLPIACRQCFFFFCKDCVSSHQCVEEVAVVAEEVCSNPLQDLQALKAFCKLMANNIVPNLRKENERFRKLKYPSKALDCLVNVLGGVRLMRCLGWELKEGWLMLGGEEGTKNRMDVNKAAENMKKVIEEIYATLNGWGKKSTKGKKKQKLRFLCVLDFEATCKEGERIKPQGESGECSSVLNSFLKKITKIL
jgi:hypothetical protein